MYCKAVVICIFYECILLWALKLRNFWIYTSLCDAFGISFKLIWGGKKQIYVLSFSLVGYGLCCGKILYSNSPSTQ